MPDPVLSVDVEMEYWYGEEEKGARKKDFAYAKKTFPQIALKEFAGMAHGELVMMFPERFHREILRFYNY